MSEHVTGFSTANGVKQYDYNALANLPGASAPSGYGLGDRSKLIDYAQIDTATKNGWYAFYSGGVTIGGVSFQYAHLRVDAYDEMSCRQTLYPVITNGSLVLTRKCSFNGVWSEWEWENPPMATDVEYRTTERYNGAAVYKKVDASGNILWRKDGETKWHLLSSSDYVATATVE